MNATGQATMAGFDDEVLCVSRGRVERIGEVLAFLSVGAFEEENITITPVEDEFGVFEQMVGQFAREHAEAVTELGRVNAERAALIERLRGAVKALSTPILAVSRGVLALPIVGELDGARAAEMSERLLERIVSAGARGVIIDITGVDDVDEASAQHLLRMVQGAELLGAYAVVVGVSPSVASWLASSGALAGAGGRGLRTQRDLQEGLRACERHLHGSTGRGGGR